MILLLRTDIAIAYNHYSRYLLLLLLPVLLLFRGARVTTRGQDAVRRVQRARLYDGVPVAGAVPARRGARGPGPGGRGVGPQTVPTAWRGAGAPRPHVWLTPSSGCGRWPAPSPSPASWSCHKSQGGTAVWHTAGCGTLLDAAHNRRSKQVSTVLLIPTY